MQLTQCLSILVIQHSVTVFCQQDVGVSSAVLKLKTIERLDFRNSALNILQKANCNSKFLNIVISVHSTCIQNSETLILPHNINTCFKIKYHSNLILETTLERIPVYGTIQKYKVLKCQVTILTNLPRNLIMVHSPFELGGFRSLRDQHGSLGI